MSVSVPLPAYDVAPTDIDGVRVGIAHDAQALTGCTAVLVPEGATAAVDVRGGAPGTRETDALGPARLVQQAHAVVLTGGSAFGLRAADGVMQALAEQNVGFDTGVARVPIVPAAVIFDLALGQPQAPTVAMGQQCVTNARRERPPEGNAGAGMGASVGKILGMAGAMKAGQGIAGVELGQGILVSALVVVNALGDVVHPTTGHILAGARTQQGGFADTLHVLAQRAEQGPAAFAARTNTVIGVVVTNARLTHDAALRVAHMAHDGLARALRPAHTPWDGDTLFVLATGERAADPMSIGAWAAEVVAWAVVRAALFAEPAGGLPSAHSLAASS